MNSQDMLKTRIIGNYIAGRTVNSDATFERRSLFYDYSVKLPNSTHHEIGASLAHSRNYRKRAPPSHEVMQIITQAGDSFSVDDEEVSYAVKMLGLPAKAVRANLMQMKWYMQNFYRIVGSRYVIDESGIYRDLGTGSLELRVPKEGSLVGHLPSGDLFPAIFVISHSLLSGRGIVIRPSSDLAYFSVKLAELIQATAQQRGIDMSGAINTVIWDRKDNTRAANFELLKRDPRIPPESRIGFGNLETLRELEVGISYDRGSCKAIVDEGSDVEKVAKSIADSALENPFACDATRMVWVHGNVAKRFEQELKEQFDKRKVGDPLEEDTDIGYVEFDPLQETINLLSDNINRRRGWEELLYPERDVAQIRLGEYQAMPIILRLHNLDSPLVTGDRNVYMVAIRHFKTLDKAVEEIRSSGLPVPLTVSYYGPDDKDGKRKMVELAQRLPSTHLNVGKNTRAHDLSLPHQGKYPFEIWTEPVSISS